MNAAKTLSVALMLVLSAYNAQAQNYFSTGTGFFITHDGYVLTAYHVVEHCKGDIGLYGSDLVIKARLAAADKKHDLALVKIIPEMEITNIAYFNPPEGLPKEGDRVIVAGYPRKSTEGVDFPQFRTNRGTIISTDKYLDKNGDKPLLFNNITEQGYSGGPVLDAAGNIIGLTLAGTCIGSQCRADFDRIMAQKPESLEQSQENNQELAHYIDANMAVSLPFLRQFMEANAIEYSEAPADNAPTVDRITEISNSIVNVRCPSTEESIISREVD